MEQRAAEILPKLSALAVEGERLYRDLLGDAQQVEHFPDYQRRIEQWRERVGRTYDAELPDSGVRLLVLPKIGIVGAGPIYYELTRLSSAIDGQKSVIRDLEKHVRRSLSAVGATH